MHVVVALAYRLAQLFLQGLARVGPGQRADDFQGFPRVGVIVLGVHLQPLHRPLAIFLREGGSIHTGRADHGGPLPRRPLDRVVGGGNRDDQRIRRAGVPAPMTQGRATQAAPPALAVLQADAVSPRPIDPIVGMVELHADIAHEVTARHILPRMTGKLGLGQVLRHVQGKLFHHRPTTNQVVAHGLGAEGVVTHALIQFVLDNPTLALATSPGSIAAPRRVTGASISGPVLLNVSITVGLLFKCDCTDQQMFQRKVPGALNNGGCGRSGRHCKLSKVNNCGRSIR